MKQKNIKINKNFYRGNPPPENKARFSRGFSLSNRNKRVLAKYVGKTKKAASYLIFAACKPLKFHFDKHYSSIRNWKSLKTDILADSYKRILKNTDEIAFSFFMGGLKTSSLIPLKANAEKKMLTNECRKEYPSGFNNEEKADLIESIASILPEKVSTFMKHWFVKSELLRMLKSNTIHSNKKENANTQESSETTDSEEVAGKRPGLIWPFKEPYVFLKSGMYSLKQWFRISFQKLSFVVRL